MIEATILDVVAGDDSRYPARTRTASVTLLSWDVVPYLALIDKVPDRWVTITDGHRIENWHLTNGHWTRVSQTYQEGTL
jgi:hypothetical protein